MSKGSKSDLNSRLNYSLGQIENKEYPNSFTFQKSDLNSNSKCITNLNNSTIKLENTERSNKSFSPKNNDFNPKSMETYDKIINNAIIKIEKNERSKRSNSELNLRSNYNLNKTYGNEVTNRSNSIVSIKNIDLNENFQNINNPIIKIESNEKPRRSNSELNLGSNYNLEKLLNSIPIETLNKELYIVDPIKNRDLNMTCDKDYSHIKNSSMIKMDNFEKSNQFNSFFSSKNIDLNMTSNNDYNYIKNNSMIKLENIERPSRSNSVVSRKNNDLNKILNYNLEKILNNAFMKTGNKESDIVAPIKNSHLNMTSIRDYSHIKNSSMVKIENFEKSNTAVSSIKNDSKLISNADCSQNLHSSLVEIEKIKKPNHLSDLSDLQKCKLFKDLNQCKRISSNLSKHKHLPLNDDSLTFLESLNKHASEKNDVNKKESQLKTESQANLLDVSFYDFLFNASKNAPKKSPFNRDSSKEKNTDVNPKANIKEKENEADKVLTDKNSSKIVESTNTFDDESIGIKGPILGLKVFACGMCKVCVYGTIYLKP